MLKVFRQSDVLALLLVAVNGASLSAQVKGTATYRERIAMPADAVFEATLGGHGKDVSVLLRRASSAGSASGKASSLGSLPATFTGDLPCADCPGIRHQLEIFPDTVFFVRLEYLGKGDSAKYDDIGAWAVSRSRDTLVLFGGQDPPVRFVIKDSSTLRKLGPAGANTTSRYDLKRAKNVQPLEPRLRMRGMYTYMADAGRFTECLTRRTWPVAQEKDNAELEAAYSKARREPAQELLADLQGQVAMRPKMEPDGRDDDGVSKRHGHRAFLDALGQVRTTKITRQHLDVFDGAGKFLARFEARLMK